MNEITLTAEQIQRLYEKTYESYNELDINGSKVAMGSCDTDQGKFDSEKGAMTEFPVTIKVDGKEFIGRTGYYNASAGVRFNHTTTFEEVKPVLKMETKTIYEVEYDNLNRFIESIYGGSFEIVAIEEANNGSSLSFNVKGEVSTLLGDREDSEHIKQGKYPMYCTGLVLNMLCNAGHIEPGEYLISISW